MIEITIPNSITSIEAHTFRGCYYLERVTIPDSVTNIGAQAFYSCDNLTSVIMPDSLISISPSVFDDTAYYNNPDNWTDGILYVGNNIVAIKSENINQNVVIKNGTKCIAARIFENCSSLTSITIPDGLTSIGRGAFRNCTNLTGVTIPDSVINIEETAFYRCTALKYAILSANIKSIGNSSFSQCSSLTDITIPNGVTSIGSSAFGGCRSMTSVTIPNSVTSIETYAFSGCRSLKKVNYSGTAEMWQAIEINYGNDVLFDNVSFGNITATPTPKPTPAPTPTPTPTPEPIIPLEVKRVVPVINAEGDEIEVPVTVVEPERAEELNEVELYVAEYDSDGRFVGLTLGTKGAIEGDTVVITADIPEAEKYKFMLWDGNNVPLMDAVEDVLG